MLAATNSGNGETLTVGFLAAVSTALNLANLNVLLNTIVLIGTAIYIWRKVLKKRK